MPETLAPAPTRLNATDIIASLADTPEFKRNQQEGYPLQRSIARSALELAGMEHDTPIEDSFELNTDEASPETTMHALIGSMPSFIYGLEGIRHDKTESRLTHREFRSMKLRAARFNHTVKALIEQDKSLNFANVSSVVTTIYGVLNRDRWGDDRKGYEAEATWFRTQFEGRLRGMQQEVLARQIIEEINRACPLKDPETGKKMPRVSVNPHVSAEDDLKGADLYVTLDGVTFPIDIKASEYTAEKFRQSSDHPSAIITTGVTAKELMGSFRISPHRAFKAAPAMLEKLYAARQEFIDKQAQASTRINVPVQELALAA